MLETNTRLALQGVILAVGVSVAGMTTAGMTTAQESGSVPAAPEVVQRTTGEIDQVAAGVEAGSAIGATRSNAPQTAPAPHIVWDAATPQLDAFGNETVPIFHSTYSGR